MNGHQVHKKVLSITNQQEDADQNHNEISPYTLVRMAIKKKDKYWQECTEIRILVQCRWECKIV